MTVETAAAIRVLALSGGVGGAKLSLGLDRILPRGSLGIVVNTADDFEPFGLHVSPDLDTTLYTLAGLNDYDRGWGRRDETWSFMSAMAELGGETWFQLGDRDLAVNVERTRRLRAGEPLSAIMASIAARLGIGSLLMPMTDDPVRTHIETDEGWLDFQTYFVRRQCKPACRSVAYKGSATARPNDQVLKALRNPGLEAVVMCPSNPLLSIDPILAIPGYREALIQCTAPVVAVSPIIGGKAVKGPTTKMLAELGHEESAIWVCRHYADIIDLFVIDDVDRELAEASPVPPVILPTLMRTQADKETLARSVIESARRFAGHIRPPAGRLN
jgi:LPPG:FO 2-phospho-L-lactate transferase